MFVVSSCYMGRLLRGSPPPYIQAFPLATREAWERFPFVTRGIFFGVAPPVDTGISPSSERGLGTFAICYEGLLLRGSPPHIYRSSPCSEEAWNLTRSSVPVRRASGQTRPYIPQRECSGEAGNPARSLTDTHTHTHTRTCLGLSTAKQGSKWV